MATRQRTNLVGNTQRVARWHSTARIRFLALPFVLGCCITLVYSAMEEMMIAPIEVIEEWGCYDTEIRLTCGNLESKIAILEARFTPRCMEQRTENCVYMDEHSVTHPFASQKVDKLILEETEAGRRFLATLRRNHERELEASDTVPGTRELTAGGAVDHREGATIVAARSLAKDKRSSLRSTLEHLIVRYLRRLTSDDDADGDGDGGEEPGGYEVAARYRRQSLPATDSDGVGNTVPDGSTSSPPAGGFSNSMEITLLTNDTDTNMTEAWEDERWDEDGNHGPLESSPLTAETTGRAVPGAVGSSAAAEEGYGSSGPSASGLVGEAGEVGSVFGASDSVARGGDAVGANGDSELRDNGDEVEYNLPIGGSVLPEMGGEMGELRQQRKKENPKVTGRRGGECDSVRKRVSQLDRFELERSMRNGSFREYNIRNALNYRQNLYLPLNHTHYSETFFYDIFARNLRFAIVGFALLILLLNAILTRKHAPIRHLLFVYELLSGTRAYPDSNQYVPNRALQLLLGIVLQIFSCALATFLVAQLSIPSTALPVQDLKDLVKHPEYRMCIPMLSTLAKHVPSLVRGHTHQKRFDRDCQRLIMARDPEKLADYLCDRKNHVLILASDAVMNTIFHNKKLLERMCDMVPIERKVIVNWLSLPYSTKFKHAELLKQLCSGKNHCSFIFSQDHPFAVVWKEGTVRIKYICMDDFRISKYCGEHLIVGNEVHWEPLDGDIDEDTAGTGDTAETYHPSYGTGTTELDGSAGSTSWREQASNEPATTGDGIANGAANDVPGPGAPSFAGLEPYEGGEDLRADGVALDSYAASPPYRRLARAGAVGEPRAEALQAATIHSFHNLKILKPADDEEEESVHEQKQQHQQHQQQRHQDRQQQQQQQHQQRQHQYNDTDSNQQEAEMATRSRNRQRQKVFSQDFRVLKILPSNLDVVEDIKQIGNEYYFKKDVEVVVDDSENEIVDSESGSSKADQPSRPTGNSSATTTEMTETLDIVVLPAPTKDIEIYDNELLGPDDETVSARAEDDISVIGLITPTRTAVTSSMTTASGEDSKLSAGRSSTPLPPTVPVSLETTLGHWDVDRLDLPETEEGSVQLAGDNRTNFARVDDGTPPPFSFNNRTFQTIQETVRQEFGESQGIPYPPLGNYDEDGEEDDFEDEDDDADEDGREERRYGGRGGTRTYGADGRLDKSHKKYMSVQRTLLKHPLRQGFLMTPSYPKYYIGDSTCRWTLYAGVHQRIKLTVLDLALRYDEECRDYLQVVDLNTNQTLFHSCTESSRPIEIVSIQERLEVSVRTTTKVIYPKRGVLIHYTALGCELPSPTPGHMRLVRRTEHRVKYVCDPLHVFPDSGETVRELICTAKHTWHRPLPACIEKRATEGSGLVSHYEQKRRYGDSDNMSDKQADTVYDILIPSLIIAGLFVVNGIVFAVIMRYRNKRKQRLDLESKELAEL